MAISAIPTWMTNLDEEDIIFIKKFILCSGSFKDIAKQYNVTYPTVRLRVNKLIGKIKLGDGNSNDNPYVKLIKQLVIDEKVDFDTAKLLISEYKKAKEIFR